MFRVKHYSFQGLITLKSFVYTNQSVFVLVQNVFSASAARTEKSVIWYIVSSASIVIIYYSIN